MRVLWFSWKDIHHPLAGGAERLGHEWRRRLVQDGHVVQHVTARYAGSDETETLDGVETIRRGRNAIAHYPAAITFHLQHTREWADVIVEEVNTVPYFTRALPGRAPTVLLYFQLAREIWFHQTPQPVAAAGYLAESVYTRLQGLGGPSVITISEDSKRDLVRYGFTADRIHIVRVAIDNAPLPAYDPASKEPAFTVLFQGSLRAMKRPIHALIAFQTFAERGGLGTLWIAGGGDDSELRQHIEQARLASRVQLFGRTAEEQKLALMRRASVLVATSVKEGWGLIVTEANSMGTPAIAYDIDGLRSAAGPHNWIAPPDPPALADRLAEASRVFSDRGAYDDWCRRVLDDSRAYTFDASYADFRRALMDSSLSTVPPEGGTHDTVPPRGGTHPRR